MAIKVDRQRKERGHKLNVGRNVYRRRGKEKRGQRREGKDMRKGGVEEMDGGRGCVRKRKKEKGMRKGSKKAR